MRAYQEELDEIERRGAALVAISPELPDGSLSFAETNALRFDVLSDVGNGVARAYGLVWKLPPAIVEQFRSSGIDLEERNGSPSWELPVPGTFVIDRGGVVRLASADPDYRNRLEPSALLAALDGLG